MSDHRLSIAARWPAVLRAMAVVVVALGFALACYWPVVHGEFVFDDDNLVVKNRALWQGHGFDFDVLAKRDQDAVRTNFRPLRFLSYQLDAWFTQRYLPFESGESIPPFFFHLQNILWHGLNTALVFFITRRILALVRKRRTTGEEAESIATPANRRESLIALWVAGIFLVHPVNVESVAYVSGRRDVLFLGFYLLAVVIQLYEPDRPRRKGDGSVPRRLLAMFAIQACFVAALLSKEMAATLPATIVVVGLLTRGRVPWRLAATTTIVGATLIGSLMAKQNPGAGAEYWGGSWMAALLTSARAWFVYWRLALWPHDLTIDYSYDVIPASVTWLEPWTGALSVVAILAIIGFAVFSWRRGRRALSLGIGLVFATWSPVSQIVLPHPERFAERFLYLPLLAMVWVLIAALAPVYRRAPVVVLALAFLLLPVALYRTQLRLPAWQTRYDLWHAAIESQPDCARAQFAFAIEATARAERKAAGTRERRELSTAIIAAFDRVIELYERDERKSAVEMRYYASARVMRAEMKGNAESLSKALDSATAARLASDDDAGAIAATRWVALFSAGRFGEALSVAERLVDDANAALPLRVNACLGIAQIHSQESRFADADAALEHGLSLTSGRYAGRIWYARGELYQRREQFERAASAFAESARLFRGEGNWHSAQYRQAESLNALREKEPGRSLELVKEVRRLLGEILEAKPDHWSSQLSLADLDFAAQYLDAAEIGYRRVFDATHDPRASKGLVRVAAARQLKASAQVAKPASETELRKHIALARLMIAENKLDKAAKALDLADRNAEGPKNRVRRLEIRALRAEILAREGEFGEAEKAYREVVDAGDPIQTEAVMLQYAQTLVELDRIEDAFTFLVGRARAGSTHPRLASTIAGLATRLHRAPDAILWYEKYLEQPSLPESERARVAELLAILRKLK